jgi:hypothetical protein
MFLGMAEFLCLCAAPNFYHTFSDKGNKTHPTKIGITKTTFTQFKHATAS